MRHHKTRIDASFIFLYFYYQKEYFHFIPSCAKKAGRPEQLGLQRRSIRRSEILAMSWTAIARMSKALKIYYLNLEVFIP
jgi:hypothetical protein